MSPCSRFRFVPAVSLAFLLTAAPGGAQEPGPGPIPPRGLTTPAELEHFVDGLLGAWMADKHIAGVTVDAGGPGGGVVDPNLADVADSQRIEEARQRRVLALLERGDELGRALLGHAVERGELGEAQGVELGQGADQATVTN